MTRSIDKGNSLEFAVRAIETAILQTFPGYQEKTFLIENKKIIVVGDVKHEIDIWVEIDLGRGYKSIFIFECKNWEKKVSKNEIIIFSEKIDAVQAQAGFFVAKSFTKDARAQAKKDSRIKLLVAKEHPKENTPIPFDFHFVVREHVSVEAMLTPKDANQSESNNTRPLDIANSSVIINGISISLSDYLRCWANEACEQNMRTFPSGQMPEDTYELETTSTRYFDVGELEVNGLEISIMHLLIHYGVRVIRPPIIWHYEVETRGRILSLAQVDVVAGFKAQVGFLKV